MSAAVLGEPRQREPTIWKPAAARDSDHELVCGAWGPTQPDGQVARCQVYNSHRGHHRAYADVDDVLAEWRSPYQPIHNPSGDVLITLPPPGPGGKLPGDSFYTEYPGWTQLRELVDQDPERLDTEIQACRQWADRLEQLDRDATRLHLEASYRRALKQGLIQP